MSEQQNLIQEYDAAATEILASLDAVHVALVNLQNVKQQISCRVAELGMVDAAGRDGPGKNLSKAVEAAVIVPVGNVASIHDHIKSARALLLGTSPNLGALEDAGITVYDWQSEFNGITPVTR